MPKKPRPEPKPRTVEIDLSHVTYSEFTVAAQAWKVPDSARFVVAGDIVQPQPRLVWTNPPAALPEPKIKRACDLAPGDKIRHPESGDWLVIFRYGDPGPDIFAAQPTGLVGWQALNNRLQPVTLSFLAAHEVAVYEEIR